MTPELQTLLNRLVERLQGTTDDENTALDHLTEGEQDDMTAMPDEFLQAFDDRLFRCATCGWWCPKDEANEDDSGDDLCFDCAG